MKSRCRACNHPMLDLEKPPVLATARKVYATLVGLGGRVETQEERLADLQWGWGMSRAMAQRSIDGLGSLGVRFGAGAGRAGQQGVAEDREGVRGNRQGAAADGDAAHRRGRGRRPATQPARPWWSVPRMAPGHASNACSTTEDDSDAGMHPSRKFRPYEPTQRFLLPPNPRDWLAPHHLASFLNELFDQLDLSRVIDAYVPPDRDKHARPIDPAPRGRVPDHLSRKDRMRRKLRTKKGRAVYRQREAIAEPPIGLIKRVLGFRRFSMRGSANAQGERAFVTAVYNAMVLFWSGRPIPGTA